MGKAWYKSWHYVTLQIAEAYGVHVVEGVLSHQLKQFVIDGNKVRLHWQRCTEGHVHGASPV